jgi:predicted nucleic acid-binding protein
LEYTNALQLKLFHQSATPAQVQAVAALVAADVKSGVLLPVVADWEKIFRAASDLARRHSAALGCRSLDVLHCATAMVVEASVFLTTDAKQKQLAAAMGLNLGVLE